MMTTMKTRRRRRRTKTMKTCSFRVSCPSSLVAAAVALVAAHDERCVVVGEDVDDVAVAVVVAADWMIGAVDD